jgi:cob(I)alamin adenosyltransferase
MVYLSRIYTKAGDGGETGLGDGTRVLKCSARVSAYGEVDELNAILGFASGLGGPHQGLTRSIQNDLFDLGADLCVPPATPEPTRALRVTAAQVERLEKEIDRLNERLEPLRSFVLPGGTALAAWLHLARTVCRRAERSVVALRQTEPVSPNVLVYLNRLSDLLFVLARIANDDGKADVLWEPGKTRQADPD